MRCNNVIVETQPSQLCQNALTATTENLLIQTSYQHCRGQKQTSKKKYEQIFLILLLFFFLLSTPLFAIEDAESTLKFIHTGLGSWIPTVKSACLWVFTALTLINWVWSFGLMALSGLGIVFNAYQFILFLSKFSPGNAFF